MTSTSNSSTLYTENCTLVAKYDPSLALALQHAKPLSPSPFTMQQAKHEGMTISMHRDPSYFLYSAYNPHKEVEKYFFLTTNYSLVLTM